MAEPMSMRFVVDTAYRAADVTTHADKLTTAAERRTGAYADLRSVVAALRVLDARTLDRIEETVSTDDERDLLDVVRIMLGVEGYGLFPCETHEHYDHDCGPCGAASNNALRDAAIALADFPALSESQRSADA